MSTNTQAEDQLVADCPLCGGEVTLSEETESGELVSCDECGGELEVISVAPLALAEAPEEEEDWGE